jgi:catalase
MTRKTDDSLLQRFSNGTGHGAPEERAKEARDATLTTRQGHPVANNHSVRTVGSRGPTTLENYHFLEKVTHFDRERIPERVVHARGAGAYGYFEAYGTAGKEPVSKYTRAKLFQEKGKRTPVFVRFSSVIHGGHSPETLRDPRGFAVKFYTEDGNWDLVGNNLKVFFIRDAMKFPDLVHAFKPDPVTNRQDARRIFDFVSLQPEATHMVATPRSGCSGTSPGAMRTTAAGWPRAWGWPSPRACRPPSRASFRRATCARRARARPRVTPSPRPRPRGSSRTRRPERRPETRG